MIQMSSNTEILLATTPADFRKGIDGLASVCLNELEKDPKSGIYFVFINRNKTMVRILAYENNGFYLCTKRLSKNKFRGWPTGSAPLTPFEAKQLQLLLWGKNPLHLQPVNTTDFPLTSG